MPKGGQVKQETAFTTFAAIPYGTIRHFGKYYLVVPLGCSLRNHIFH